MVGIYIDWKPLAPFTAFMGVDWQAAVLRVVPLESNYNKIRYAWVILLQPQEQTASDVLIIRGQIKFRAVIVSA